jgi:hypothetical protein
MADESSQKLTDGQIFALNLYYYRMLRIIVVDQARERKQLEQILLHLGVPVHCEI